MIPSALLQTAQTTDFMILGLGVVIGIMALFVGYLALRMRNLRRDLELIESMDDPDG